MGSDVKKKSRDTWRRTKPSARQVAAGGGVRRGGALAAAARDDAAQIERLISSGEGTEVRDGHGRTSLHVAARVTPKGCERWSGQERT